MAVGGVLVERSFALAPRRGTADSARRMRGRRIRRGARRARSLPRRRPAPAPDPRRFPRSAHAPARVEASMEARMLVPFPEKPRTPPPARASEDPLAALLARVAEGDEAAFRALYDATSARVLGLALRILRDRAAAEEALVDVFAQVWRQARRYDATKSCVATWITTLARTRAIDLARIQKRRTRGEVAIDKGLSEGLRDRGPEPAASASGGEHAE